MKAFHLTTDELNEMIKQHGIEQVIRSIRHIVIVERKTAQRILFTD